jgi:NTE family protein
LRVKTALVLSAGGMFGAYEAGAWKALARRIRPDVVVGASVGALNGWAIAGGATPSDLIELWLGPDNASLASLRLSRRPWRGILDPGPIEDRIEALWKGYRPQVEIGIVAVELRSLRPRLFRNNEITLRHLAASCAVLTCYPQVRLGSRLYTDGGLLVSLPLWAAAEMGASRIVAVNALPQLPSRVVRAAVGAFRAVAPPTAPPPAGAEIRIIAPSRTLGTLRHAMFWNEAAIRRAIELGEADAEKATREPWSSP